MRGLLLWGVPLCGKKLPGVGEDGNANAQHSTIVGVVSSLSVRLTDRG